MNFPFSLKRSEISRDTAGQGRLVWFFLAIGIAILAVSGYILASQAVQGIGFPLDDAWIYQTYARNLADLGQWAFVPGQPSAGSTAPLWSVLLSASYLLRISPFLWTFLLGIISLAALALVGEKWFRSLTGSSKSAVPIAGIFLAGEWHLTWSAASGMETVLFSLFIVAVFYLLARDRKEWLIGLLIGISIWIRPDGITLLGPVLFQYLLTAHSWHERLTKSIKLMLPFLIPLASYLLFNQAISQTWLPNTFYAKQAEYVIYQQFPIWDRILSLITLPLIGAGFLLAPSFIYFAWKSIQHRAWDRIAVILWWFGYTFLYALRLPVTYQHGRYLIPAMPVFFILGMVGLSDLFNHLHSRFAIGSTTGNRWSFVIRMVPFGWSAAVAVLWLAMIGIGAFTYAQDVSIINTEMVAASQWVAAYTAPNAIIGAHDIGALGYFGKRQILDLAGLVSPEVIPFIRDEKALGNYLSANHANYLMTFPGWYPDLVQNRLKLFQTNGSYSISAGGENMTVYQWP